MDVKNNSSQLGEEKNDLVISTKSRSKLSKSEEMNNLNNNFNNNYNCNNHNSPRNDNQNEADVQNQNCNENKANFDNQSPLKNNIVNNNQSILSTKKIIQGNENNSNSNFNNSGKFNANQAKHESNNHVVGNGKGSNKNIGQKTNYANKKDDTSIVDITSASRVVTDEEVKNAPMLTIEVKIIFIINFLIIKK